MWCMCAHARAVDGCARARYARAVRQRQRCDRAYVQLGVRLRIRARGEVGRSETFHFLRWISRCGDLSINIGSYRVRRCIMSGTRSSTSRSQGSHTRPSAWIRGAVCPSADAADAHQHKQAEAFQSVQFSVVRSFAFVLFLGRQNALHLGHIMPLFFSRCRHCGKPLS